MLLNKEYLLKTQADGIIFPCNIAEEVVPLSEESLYQQLVFDLSSLKLPVDEVTLEFRPYSETYYGRYFPSKHRIFIYPYMNKNGDFLSYSKILCTTIHEMVHHIQYQDVNFKRNKGIMHDPQFWKLYNHFVGRAIKYEILTEEEVKKDGN